MGMRRRKGISQDGAKWDMMRLFWIAMTTAVNSDFQITIFRGNNVLNIVNRSDYSAVSYSGVKRLHT